MNSGNPHWLAALAIYLATDRSTFEEQARSVGDFILIIWAIHIVNWGFGRGGLNWVFGVRPRELTGIFGIFTAPFLHSVRRSSDEPNNSHIVGNTLSLAVLGLFIALQGLHLFYVVTIASALASGLGTWLFGREGTNHVGVSGVIFGYRGFLIIYGLTSHNLLAFFLGVVSLILYGSRLVNILPADPRFRMSWEGHLFGFLGGMAIGYLISYIKLQTGQV